MAGRLVTSTINDDTGVLATQNGMTGIAKAWVNFNGLTTPPTIRGAMNISSITKNTTGDYTLNFTTAMPNTNYSVSQIGTSNTPSVAVMAGAMIKGTAASGINNFNAGSFDIITGYGNQAGLFDFAYIGIQVFSS
jgi:hypothetical protein